MKKLLLILIFMLTMSCSVYADPAAFNYLTYICENYPCREFDKGAQVAAGAYISSELAAMGYDVNVQDFYAGDYFFDHDVTPLNGRNIYVDIPGQTDKQIVVGAHYDCVDTQGCDDNASGVAVLLSLAKSMYGTKPPCSVRLIFFDDEEEGYIGSGYYCKYQTAAYFDDLLFMINIDSIAAGDYMYIHGGDNAGANVWARDYALSRSAALDLDFTMHPDVNGIPAGTRFGGSDQLPFGRRFVPYIYLEAGVYSDASADGNPVHYQTEDPRVENHQIMHTPYDNLSVLNELFPGRIESHLDSAYSLCMDLLLHTDTNGSYVPDGISVFPYEKSTDTASIERLYVYYHGEPVLGEPINLKDCSLRTIYTDGSERTCSYWSCIGYDEPLVYGDNVITFYYAGFKYDLVISIKEPVIEEPSTEVMPTEIEPTQTEPALPEPLPTETAPVPIETEPIPIETETTPIIIVPSIPVYRCFSLELNPLKLPFAYGIRWSSFPTPFAAKHMGVYINKVFYSRYSAGLMLRKLAFPCISKDIVVY